MSDSPDVLQELDAWIALYPHANIAQRARDEIVELRKYLKGELTVSEVLDMVRKARAEALEEAAKMCDAKIGTQSQSVAAVMWDNACALCAVAIRRLKRRPEA